jgi:hypothetical protein
MGHLDAAPGRVGPCPNDPIRGRRRGDPAVNDPAENGPAEHPLDAIQEGINAANDAHDEVVVLNGAYTGPGNRDLAFNNNPITQRLVNRNPNGVAIDCQELGRDFLFDNDEDSSYVAFGFMTMNGVAGGLNGVGGRIRCGARRAFQYAVALDRPVLQSIIYRPGTASVCRFRRIRQYGQYDGQQTQHHYI